MSDEVVPLPEMFRRIAEEPIDGELDRMTWRAAWLAAAWIADESRLIKTPVPRDGGAA